MKESQIEAKLVKMVEERGGMCLKFISPGRRGVPDRIVITPTGHITFVELKTESGKLQPIQKWQIEEMRKRHVTVWVLKGRCEVEAFVAALFPQGVPV